MVKLQPAPLARQASKFIPPQAGLAIEGMTSSGFNVYILYSKQLGRFYTGFSEHCARRRREHLRTHLGWTAQADDWVEVHREPADTRMTARALEKRIKKRGARRYLLDTGADLQELLDSR